MKHTRKLTYDFKLCKVLWKRRLAVMKKNIWGGVRHWFRLRVRASPLRRQWDCTAGESEAGEDSGQSWEGAASANILRWDKGPPWLDVGEQRGGMSGIGGQAMVGPGHRRPRRACEGLFIVTHMQWDPWRALNRGMAGPSQDVRRSLRRLCTEHPGVEQWDSIRPTACRGREGARWSHDVFCR